MNASRFRRYLAKQGSTFKEGKRHTIVRRGTGSRRSPRHGGSKQLGTGLINSIKKDLGLAMALNPRQIDRLLDLRHSSTIAQLEQALTVGGKRVEVELRELEVAA